MFATINRRTAIYCTRVCITTIQETTRDTGASVAIIPLGAGVTVSTCTIRAFVRALPRFNATVCSAHIVVVAIESRSCLTLSVYALVVDGTWISIVARSRDD